MACCIFVAMLIGQLVLVWRKLRAPLVGAAAAIVAAAALGYLAGGHAGHWSGVATGLLRRINHVDAPRSADDQAMAVARQDERCTGQTVQRVAAR